MFLGEILETAGAACFAVAAAILIGAIGALTVAGIFLIYQAHLGQHGDRQLRLRITWPKLNLSRLKLHVKKPARLVRGS